MLKRIWMLLIWLFVCLIFAAFSSAAQIYLVPETENLLSNCENNIDIMIDSRWQEIFWASVNMQYDWKKIELVWFYVNNIFNLPLNVEKDNLWSIKSSLLSLIRGDDFRQIWFTGIIKYGTLVIKNKEPITETEIDFLFSWQGNTLDNMNVFKLGNAQDILESVQPWKFTFINGQCLHQAPEGINQTDTNYNYQDHINGNLKNIANLEKQMKYKQWFQNNIDMVSYILIILLIIVLMVVMYKKWLLKDIHLNILKSKKNENA